MISNKFYVLGKFLDQPKLVNDFSKAVPLVLSSAALTYGVYDTYKADEKNRKNKFIQNASVLAVTVISALTASHGISFIKRANGAPLLKGLIENSTHDIAQGVDLVVKKIEGAGHKVSESLGTILNKAKTKILTMTEVSALKNELEKVSSKTDNLMHHIIPDPKSLNAKEIFGEIKNLSLLGFIPVLGGITGGVIGDKITGSKWKQKLPDKLKEGFYQFFANIFLCNVGAGVALALLEKAKIKSSAARALGMTTGILATGVVGGSFIANYLAKKVINPIFDKKCKQDEKELDVKSLYAERHPEVVDVALHVDDIATVGVLSGLKWIAPALPIMYTLSGYRAGIGYRN